MTRFYWVDEDIEVARKYGGEAHGSPRWALPGLMQCPACGETWSDVGHHFPGVDLTALPQRREFERARPEPFPEFVRLRELVRPLVPPEEALPPGAGFGPLVGTAVGTFPAFAWIIEVLLIRAEVLGQLHAQGMRNLQGHPTALRSRRNPPPELLELHVLPRGRLHGDCLPPDEPPPCPTCGWFGLRRPEEPILDEASLPSDMELFRVGNFATMVIGTERFKDTVEQLGLDGLTFLEVPTR
ncbi:double-CXXCG motif protein [Myxococcus sp. K38C18041901]|uniref:SitI6 family double-CXXCG motif immunity protein n=1 Tax=Myxococcus guangdongensis TaxID=2906760 RepID=UPI0020A7EAAA|nr:double-CXXCG motif protein [Myxococcus guangdongensis]MCP3058987.1 double-CXXCG motif protein [Myxococcus guangdongensis]